MRSNRGLMTRFLKMSEIHTLRSLKRTFLEIMSRSTTISQISTQLRTQAQTRYPTSKATTSHPLAQKSSARVSSASIHNNVIHSSIHNLKTWSTSTSYTVTSLSR